MEQMIDELADNIDSVHGHLFRKLKDRTEIMAAFFRIFPDLRVSLV